MSRLLSLFLRDRPLLPRRGFVPTAWSALGVTLIVILWGAFVRASDSGNGCGDSWPTCRGAIIPDSGTIHTLIEFLHRSLSGIDIILIFGLFIWAQFAFPRRHPARLGSALAAFFIVTEALLGAGLVLYNMVGNNASIARAAWVSGHLANTFFLVGSVTLTAYWASGGSRITLRRQGPIGWALGAALASVVILGASGAVTALGDTLFPASSLASGVQQDFGSTASFYTQIRVVHPLIAVAVGLYLLLIIGLVSRLRPTRDVRFLAKLLGVAFVTQALIGLLNLVLLTPIPMQLIHLLFADAVWVCAVLLAAAAFAVDAPHVELGQVVESEASSDGRDETREYSGSSSPVSGGGRLAFEFAGAAGQSNGGVMPAPSASALAMVHSGLGGATWRDYLALTKPRVISLLLFTTVMAMFIAARGWPGLGVLAAVLVGGYMAPAAAGVFNMVLDRDIDCLMKRTSSRPIVTNKVSSRDALSFAFALAFGSFVILWVGANLLTAVLALAGLVWYVLIYTMYLKRRSVQNIVIGGAAGAFPPLVGWAAVAGTINPLGWILFAVIFFWTPAHFWPLSIMIKDDYERVGVPMLPVVQGIESTARQVLLYAVITAAASLAPLFLHELGWLYLAAAVALDGILIGKSLSLIRVPDRAHALSLYKYTMLYLALLFFAMAIDRIVLR